jgi:translocation and assembly module TamA
MLQYDSSMHSDWSARLLMKRCAFWLVSLLLWACASIPPGQYGVVSIEWKGVKDMAPEALASCLVTRERDASHIRLGLGAPSCGKPPFDSSAPSFEIWTLPWTEWPIYDPAIFEVERQRIVRWYAARGYFDARIESVQTFAGGKQVNADECPAQADCKLKIVVKVFEGKPTQVAAVSIKTDHPLPAKLLAQLQKSLELKKSQRFDEASYQNDKDNLKAQLIEASYARAKVTGKVSIDRNTREATVEYDLTPGLDCVFGVVKLEGNDDIPPLLLLEAANIRAGTKFSQSVVDDAQRAIFALNVFSVVDVELQGQGRVVDLLAKVERGRITRWSAGAGLMSGTLRRTGSVETTSVPQWDIHLSGSYENRDFLGGLRKLRIEERPRLIFLREFPGVNGGAHLGNSISITFEQPSTFEARTKLYSSAGWDVGPDPFQGFFRHDVAVKVGLERPFWRRRFRARFALEHDFYWAEKNRPGDVSNYVLPFLEQQVTLDLRGDSRKPRLGGYADVLVQETSRLGSYGSWDYIRVLPDLRAYVPVAFDIILAARFAVGGLFVLSHASDLDAASAILGPNVYRMRGGGANSDRGFGAGELGDGLVGGSRRYEGSLELRVPLGGDFGFVVFGDVGDVHTSWRFNHLNTAAGAGLRYSSVLGALRFDAGWRIPGAQIVSGHGADDVDTYKGSGWPSAVHLTIGEAF